MTHVPQQDLLWVLSSNRPKRRIKEIAMKKLIGAQQAPPGQETRFAQSASSAALGSQGNYIGATPPAGLGTNA